jgi:hypothetical protein
LYQKIQEVNGMAIRIPVQDCAPTVAFEDAVQFVLESLGSVLEFRSTRGRQIELHGTLALAVLAMLAGHTGYRDIEMWGKLREETLIPLLGLARAPSDSRSGGSSWALTPKRCAVYSAPRLE